MITIANKKLIWIIGFILLLPSFVSADFFPDDNINSEANNITNVSRIEADFFCFNNGTCFGLSEINLVEINSMFGVALILSILGTSFLFVYIATQIGTTTENIKRPILLVFIAALKGLLIFSAMILPVVAINANPAIWSAAGITNTVSLSIYTTGAYRVALYIPILIITLVIIFFVTDAILSVIDKRRQ